MSTVTPPTEMEQLVAQLIDPARPFAEQKEALTDAFARAYLRALLQLTGGNQSEAARIAGLNRSYLGRMLSKHGLGKGGTGR